LKNSLPEPSLIRLCKLYRLLQELEQEQIRDISSAELSEKIGFGSHNIRKDISFLGEAGHAGLRYNATALKEHIGFQLGLNKSKKACIVGLGRLGASMINYEKFKISGYEIVAGFDSNINKLETLHTNVELFPSHQIAEVVKRKAIELAVLTVPPDAVHDVSEKLVSGGVRGIVNFAPVLLTQKWPGVFIRNIDMIGEFDILSAMSNYSGDRRLHLNGSF